ncbi:MAG TPA: RsiV family protein [Candidatus Paceibacterota bacterium]
MTRYSLLVIAILAVVGAGYLAFWQIPEKSVQDAAQPDTAQAQTHVLKEDAKEYSIDVEYPQFGIPEFDAVIQKSIDDMVAEIKTQAATDTPVAKGLRKYELYGSITKTYLDSDVASAHIVFGQDFGGAHPLPIVMTFNFDRRRNKEMALDDALSMIGLSLQGVAAQAQEQLQAKLGNDIIAPEGAEPKTENYRTFFVGTSTVTFIFQPYQVAPYVAGAPEVVFDRQ